MDESQNTLENSSDATFDDLSNSLIGKVKCSVSKMLPTSLSNWLSPQVDRSRRRHRDFEVDIDQTDASTFQPSTKRQKTLETNSNSLNSYSPSTSAISIRNNIGSSTLIEEPSTRKLFNVERNGSNLRSHLNVATDVSASVPISLSQPSVLAYRRDRELDETSSNVSTNPFATNNNDSLAVNFSAHLQKSKSLFSNKSYVSSSSRSLSNYRMRRQPNSSIYRSTSSLCDNNSNSSTASSAIASPFYSGQTTFGGASAVSKRFNSGIQMHRSAIPSRLVPSNLSKSTSSLNTATEGSSSCLSSTAKRILDLMNQFNTPLTDVRRVSNALPTSTANVSGVNKRLSVLDNDKNNDVDRLKRKLLKPNTPYNRPVGRSASAIESSFTQELQVPSMSQLLQLKKLTNNTIKVRDLAAKSDSILNKTQEIRNIDFDKKQEDSKNNNTDHTNKRITKIRNNISKKRVSKNDHSDVPPEPVNLPSVQLKMDKPSDIKFSFSSFQPPKVQTIETIKPSLSLNTNIKSTTLTHSLTLNSNSISATIPSTSILSNTKTTVSKAPEIKNTPLKTPPAFKPVEKINNNSKPLEFMNEQAFKFKSPIFVTNELSKTNSIKCDETNFKFSQPVFVDLSGNNEGQKNSVDQTNLSKNTNKTKPETKSSSNSEIKTNTFTSNITSFKPPADASKIDSTWKDIAAKQKVGKWICSSCCTPNEKSSNKCVCCGENAVSGDTKPSEKPSSSVTDSEHKKSSAIVDDMFKSIANKQKQTHWTCNTCMATNDLMQNECACCGDKKLTTIEKVKLQPETSKTDDLFKSIVDKQKSSTWACSVCDTKNDNNKTKCVCCEQVNPLQSSKIDTTTSDKKFTFGSGSISLGVPANKFSFGSKPSEIKPISTVKGIQEPSSATTSSQLTFGSSTQSFSFGNLSKSKLTDNVSPQKPTEKLSTTSLTFGNSVKVADKPTFNVNTDTGTAVVSSSKDAPPVSNEITPKISSTLSLDPDTQKKSVPDDVFKKIISQQNSKWSCEICMVQNNNNVTVCASCTTPKPGAGPSTSENKTEEVKVNKTKFSFGSIPSNNATFCAPKETLGNSGFKFGSQPQDNKNTNETKIAPTFSFGASATSANTSSFSSSTSSGFTFGSMASTPKVESDTSKPQSTPLAMAFSKPTAEFHFGSSSFNVNEPKPVSSDVTDAKFKSDDTKITVLENIQVKPATTDINENKPMLFGFGSKATNVNSFSFKPVSESTNQPQTLKSPATSNIISTTPFTFGKSSIVPQIDSQVKSALVFGSNSIPIGTPQPFVFNTGSSPNPTSQFSIGASSPSNNAPVFGSKSFSSNPEPFKTNAFNFGSPTPFGNTTTNNSTETAKAPSLFQFGSGNNNNASTTKPSFNFSAGAKPSFNFSAGAPAQPQTNTLFQFGASADPTASNIYTPQSTSNAMQQRRKLRPVRRVNRP